MGPFTHGTLQRPPLAPTCMHSLLSGTGVRPAPHWEHTAEPGLMETVKPGQTEHVPPITSLYWPGKARVGGGEQARL